VAIIGILSAIAYPAYTNSMYKSRRADAITKLLEIHLAQERYRANNSSYGTLAQIGLATTNDGYYTLAEEAPGTNSYAITAIIVSGGRQDGDTCDNFVVNQNGPAYAAGADQACWGN
jgi:type IV pilus assembly protein PilE